MRSLIYLSIASILTFLILEILYLRATEDLPPPEEKVPTSAKITYSNGKPLYIPRSEWIPLSKVPKVFKDMLISAEDRRFYSHHGIDFKGILRAFLTNIKMGGIVQGGSTITQQLSRLLYLTQERTLRRKVKEFFVALWLERIRSKDEILELYINSVYLGNGIYGFQTAAMYYFSRNLWELNLAQMASLIGTIRSPERFNPRSNLELSKKKALSVLKSALEAGAIEEEDFEEALKELEKLDVSIKTRKIDEELFWRVVKEAKELTGLSLETLREGYTIVTTIDEDLQGIVDTKIGTDSACVAIDSLGRILSYKGIGAWRGRRHVGSGIKPMYYLLALLSGIEPHDILPDFPIDIDGWKPKNFTKNFGVESTVLDALVYSRNIPSVFLFSTLGVERVESFMKNVLKIEGRYPHDMTLALGTIETAPEQILKFYTALMTGGIVLKPTIISKIIDDDGNVVYSFKPIVMGSIPDGIVDHFKAISVLKGMMVEVVGRGTGWRSRVEGKESFGKTGTSEMNAWFTGGDDNFSMSIVKDGTDLLGGRDVAPIWKDIASEWGRFEGEVSYSKPSGGGVIVFDEEMLDFIDFTELASSVNSGKIDVERLASFLEDLGDISFEFLERLESVDSTAASLLEGVIGWRRSPSFRDRPFSEKGKSPATSTEF